MSLTPSPIERGDEHITPQPRTQGLSLPAHLQAALLLLTVAASVAQRGAEHLEPEQATIRPNTRSPT